MSQIIDGLKYTQEHEWVKDNGDGTATCGITDHAQHMLTDIVFAELPENGKVLSKGDRAAVVESVKAVSDIYSPVSGEVIEANLSLEDAPENINEDPYGNGWIFKLKMSNPEELSGLMDAAAYKDFVESGE